MTSSHVKASVNHRNRIRFTGLAAMAAGGVGLLVAAVLVLPSPASAATATVGLGTADPYSVLGSTAVTNTGPTTVSGGLGISPNTASSVTGFPPGLIGGATNAGNAAALQARNDLTTAYNDAASRPATGGLIGPALVGRTLTAGVYKANTTLDVGGPLTLDGQGNTDAVFIFQVGSTLTTDSASSVIVSNGAQACNVFWQVGSSATLGTASSFKGTVMALTSVTVTTGTTVEGRALARNGAVTLDDNVFTQPSCASPSAAGSSASSAAAGFQSSASAAASRAASSSSAARSLASAQAQASTRSVASARSVAAALAASQAAAKAATANDLAAASRSSDVVLAATSSSATGTGLASTGVSPLTRSLLWVGVALVGLGTILLVLARRTRSTRTH